MSDQAIVSTQRAQALTASSKVLRNTYALLALTLLFSALTAALSMAVNAPYLGLLSLLPYFGLLYATEKSKNSGWGLVWVFA
ncbi:MAG TPA: FtsH protease modulator YccA, partial [Pseudomonadales bacterium]|nr:FtsH protease modulator YccA [Pseudomonadales bacterium]